MSIAMIVYLASISDPAHAVVLSLASCVGIGGLVSMMTYFTEHKGYMAVWISLLVVSFLLCCLAAITPMGSDIYKIAGVTDQQKASIDATGKVIQEGVKK